MMNNDKSSADLRSHVWPSTSNEYCPSESATAARRRPLQAPASSRSASIAVSAGVQNCTKPSRQTTGCKRSGTHPSRAQAMSEETVRVIVRCRPMNEREKVRQNRYDRLKTAR